MTPTIAWRRWVARLVLGLWGLQIVWLIWHFAPEAGDLAQRVLRRDVGSAIRQEEPLYRWAAAVQAVIPETATYVFLDDYAAGKEIEVRYYLAPRRHLLLSPAVPASFLFFTLRQENAAFLLIREGDQPLGPGALAALGSPAFRRLSLPGPGLILQADTRRLPWGFYD